MSKRKERENKSQNRTISYILISFFFILGLTLGILYKTIYPTREESPFIQTRTGGYEFINPLVDFESTDSAKIADLVKLESNLETYIQEKTESYKITNVSHISVYYKDLNSGAWIGIEEDREFSPASLLKLPIMISAYKIAEQEEGYLEREIQFKREYAGATPNIPPEKVLIEDQMYKLDDLINQLIIYSDNDALAPIEALTNYDDLIKIYQDLGLRNPYEPENENTMTVKEYASFFRILYNASYLSKEMSEKALRLLSQVQYDEGIASGIPSDIVIANKFGEREYTQEPVYEKKQLHDCGIVYHPKKPYILCIMTKGSSFENLQGVMKDISTIIFNKVNKE